jgi:hypothetical protein
VKELLVKATVSFYPTKWSRLTAQSEGDECLQPQFCSTKISARMQLTRHLRPSEIWKWKSWNILLTAWNSWLVISTCSNLWTSRLEGFMHRTTKKRKMRRIPCRAHNQHISFQGNHQVGWNLDQVRRKGGDYVKKWHFVLICNFLHIWVSVSFIDWP